MYRAWLIILLISCKAFQSNAQNTYTYYEFCDSVPVAVGNCFVLKGVWFEFAKGVLKPESFPSLEVLVKLLNDNPSAEIDVSGHTSESCDECCIILSQKRAQSVCDFLIQSGIDPGRLVAKGYEDNKPYVVQKWDLIKYKYLEEGALLTSQYLNVLPSDQRIEASGLLRRIEIKILSTNYIKR